VHPCAQHIRKKKEGRGDVGCRAATLINEEDLSFLRYGLLQKGSRLLQKRKEEKQTERTDKQGRERGSCSEERKREKLCFLTATSIRDWGFVCGPILMKF
jgi:hypothetical protein